MRELTCYAAVALLFGFSNLSPLQGQAMGAVRLAVRDGFITVEPGVDLYFKSYGTGRDTVVVLHGGPGFGLNYLAPDLLPLARTRTVIFYDQRTAGRSTSIADTVRNNATTSVADLEAVRRNFRLSKLSLIGHSWGSLLAGLYAARYPDRVHRMVLIGSSAPARAVRDSLPPGPIRIDSARQVWLDAHENTWRSDPADSLKACWNYWAINILDYFEAPIDARSLWGDVCNMSQATLLTKTRGHPHRSLIQQGFDLRRQLRNVGAPVLVIHGEEDIVSPLSARAWVAALPRARLLLIPEAGHFPHVDAPELFFKEVDAFLREGADPPPLSAYDQLLDRITRRSHQLAEELSSQQWDRAALMYDEEALLLGPGAPPVQGRQSVTSYWRTAHARGMRNVSLFTMEVEREGDLVIETGKYVVRGKEGSKLDVGKYLVTWRRRGQQWRIHRDIYNSNLEQRSVLELPDYLPPPLGTWEEARLK